MFDEFIKIVSKIIDENGDKILINERQFLSIFSDYAPGMEKERKLLKLAISSGAFREITSAKHFDLDKQNEACIQAICYLKDEMIKDEIAEQYVHALADGIGVSYNSKNVNYKETKGCFISETPEDNNITKQKVEQLDKQYRQYVLKPAKHKQKRNLPILPIILIVLAAIVIVAVVLGIMLFGEKDKNKENNDGITDNNLVVTDDISDSKASSDSDDIKQISISPYERKEISAGKVSFLTFDGYISEGQENTHVFTAEEAGTYGFQITELSEGLKLTIVTYENGEKGDVKSDCKLGREGIILYKTEKGTTCELVVSGTYGKGSGNYSIVIGQQKEAIDVSDYTTISDSMEFKSQTNRYFYTAKENGKCCIKISSIKNGNTLKIFLYDGYGELISHSTGDRDTYLLASLEKGEEYMIEVHQDKGLADYVIDVLPQKPTVDITGYQEVKDSIEYEYQNNFYKFTPQKDGEFDVLVSHIQNEFDINIGVYDDEGYEVKGMKDMVKDDSFSVHLKKDQTYTFSIRGSAPCEYSFRVIYGE